MSGRFPQAGRPGRRPSLAQGPYDSRIAELGRAAGRALATLVLSACVLPAGCAGEDPAIALRRDLIETRDQLRQARDENALLREQIRQRDAQIAGLQALGGEARLARLFPVQRVRIGNYSTGIARGEEPADSGVKVLLEPLDAAGNSMKAAGDVTIQLYDLAAPPGENLLHEDRFPAEEIANKWTSGLFSQYYVFECFWGQKAPRHDQITVRVVFLDVLTGKSFTDQKVVPVVLPAPRTATQPAPQQPQTATAPSRRE